MTTVRRHTHVDFTISTNLRPKDITQYDELSYEFMHFMIDLLSNEDVIAQCAGEDVDITDFNIASINCEIGKHQKGRRIHIHSLVFITHRSLLKEDPVDGKMKPSFKITEFSKSLKEHIDQGFYPNLPLAKEVLIGSGCYVHAHLLNTGRALNYNEKGMVDPDPELTRTFERWIGEKEKQMALNKIDN